MPPTTLRGIRTPVIFGNHRDHRDLIEIVELTETSKSKVPPRRSVLSVCSVVDQLSRWPIIVSYSWRFSRGFTMAAHLGVTFTGLRFENPFLLASAPPTESDTNIMRAFDAGWGGVVT